MNFLMRSTSHVHVERTPIPESPQADTPQTTSGTSSETLDSEDPYSRLSTIEEFDGEIDGENGNVSGNGSRKDMPILAKHVDVSEEEGWIAIPCKELPKSWNDVSDIQSLHSLDRSFLFPGEQVQIVACLSACKHDTEIITPFKVAAMMSKNGIGHSPEKQNGNIEDRSNSGSGEGQISSSSQEQKEESLSKPKADHPADVSAGESLLRMEVHKRQTALLLQRFENSHFFVRISEYDEPLWSKRSSSEKSSSSEFDDLKASTIGVRETAKDSSSISAIIDRGNFDANISGGVARNSVKCFALPNGDIVVLLQVNVGVNFLRDPCIEILQYEKYQDNVLSPQNQGSSVNMSQDQCGELLMWLLPLDNTLSSPSRPLSPTKLPSSTGTGSASHRHHYSASAGSQSFFAHFRSYSMSSLPQNTSIPPVAPVKAASSKPAFDMEDWDQISFQKLRRKNDVEELLSFRGVSLERERFSVCCGLEGIYTPGRRWRRKLEIIQPVEIHSFAADCNTDDLLCVQIKNVAPADAPDIVIFIDAITIVFDEATKSGLPSSLPISCIEAGHDHSLPNLALRRGEEHSFILKPATWKNLKMQDETNSQLSKSHSGNSASSLNSSPQSLDRRKAALNDDQYAIVVSCRCNYTASQLFFKQPTSWRPRTSRDILISVASEMSGESPGPYARNSPLPVQVLTLQASNFTSEDLTLTVLAPASFTSPPSVVSLNSPTSSMSPFVGFTEFLGRVNVERHTSVTQGQSFSPLVKENEKQSNHGAPQSSSMNDVIPSSGLSCTHLWLQSRVPLGCVPSQSTATIKLELLPLTDGIITLDSLQINVKEKESHTVMGVAKRVGILQTAVFSRDVTALFCLHLALANLPPHVLIWCHFILGHLCTN
ncbi:uncharacterized protein LOC107631908 isoform X1 [Arachis ipaensis]|uniref:uncharacterized protein LOC107631908 isoform X1 n=1 Tax=Arachis ipaensis TaxID=130454 RepID=UPI000A2B7485|nr:uncharacterized protein LOC107631908 isoform X1 [Arachis ipaensis]XP_025638988.1 uncharacterized protein LOC112734027 isoform X1 [Arachis hypogaea]